MASRLQIVSFVVADFIFPERVRLLPPEGDLNQCVPNGNSVKRHGIKTGDFVVITRFLQELKGNPGKAAIRFFECRPLLGSDFSEHIEKAAFLRYLPRYNALVGITESGLRISVSSCFTARYKTNAYGGMGLTHSFPVLQFVEVIPFHQLTSWTIFPDSADNAHLGLLGFSSSYHGACRVGPDGWFKLNVPRQLQKEFEGALNAHGIRRTMNRSSQQSKPRSDCFQSGVRSFAPRG